MSVFVKVYAHQGWRYYLPLGVVKPEPITVLPFTAAEYDNNRVWTDKLSGRNLLAYNNDDQTREIYKIIGNPNALLLNGYRNDSDLPLEDTASAFGLFGNALTMRIKPGQFPDSSMLLCVLYGKGGSNSEKLMVAVKDCQIITYYMALDDEDNIKKAETGIYINDSDQWTSIGFNFCSNTDAGLAGVYVNGEYERVDILPLQQSNHFSNPISSGYSVSPVKKTPGMKMRRFTRLTVLSVMCRYLKAHLAARNSAQFWTNTMITKMPAHRLPNLKPAEN